jgi:hypothetical protein
MPEGSSYRKFTINIDCKPTQFLCKEKRIGNTHNVTVKGVRIIDPNFPCFKRYNVPNISESLHRLTATCCISTYGIEREHRNRRFLQHISYLYGKCR